MLEEGDVISERLSQLPYGNIFNKAAEPINPKQSESNRSLAARLHSLSQRDLHAYYTKISWPQKLYTDPIKMSESYTNPNTAPNPCIKDSDEVAESKQAQVLVNDFMAYYLDGKKKRTKKAA